MGGVLSFVSILIGWIYFLSWSASFYPQPLLNRHRRSTSGTTVDFPLLNCLGYVSYLLSNLFFYYSPLIRHQYALRHHGLPPTVRLNDVAFALHALILSLVTASQYILSGAWGFGRQPGNKPSLFVLGLCGGTVAGVLLIWERVRGADANTWCELDVVYAIGYVKVVVTLVKYTPQIVANWRNQSTRGWSVWQILLDVVGGVLSLAQLGIDSYLQGDWSGVLGNPAKLAIGNASLFFDGVFLVQHYGLYYGESLDDGDETERMWRGDRESLNEERVY